MMNCWPHGCNWSKRTKKKYIDNSGGGWGSCEDRMSTDSQESLKRPTHFDKLEALFEKRNLEREESSLDGIQEPSIKRPRWNDAATCTDKDEAVLRSEHALPSVVKKPACYSEQDCNLTEDTYCFIFLWHTRMLLYTNVLHIYIMEFVIVCTTETYIEKSSRGFFGSQLETKRSSKKILKDDHLEI